MKNKNQNYIYYLFLLSFFLLTNSACKSDDPQPSNLLKVGDAYQGGKIAYLLQAGDPGYNANTQHGLIAAEADQASAIFWDTGNSTETGANATVIGSGDENTASITLAVGSGNYAAKVCAGYFKDDYSDWYLPSLDELAKLYLNRAAIGGFTSGSYWSSTETSAENAMVVHFSNGNTTEVAKFGDFSVRAIRYF